MNSIIIKNGSIIALGLCVIQGARVKITTQTDLQQQHKLNTRQGGIFGRMIEQVEAPQELVKEKAEAKERKQRQLDDAEKDYQLMVQKEEKEESDQKKKEEDAAVLAAEEAAKRTPQAQMLAAANAAASNINVGDLEANIQAQLEARLANGASKSDILASLNNEDTMAQTAASSGIQAVQAVEAKSTASSSTQAVIASVLAKHKQAHAAAAAFSPPPAPVAKPIAMPQRPVQAPSQPTQSMSQVAQTAEQKASQEKVKEMAGKLGIPFTGDLMALGSNSAISDALIEKAIAAGKSESQITSAMNSL